MIGKQSCAQNSILATFFSTKCYFYKVLKNFLFILFIRVDRTGYRISPALLPHHLVRILPSHGRLRAYELPISSRCASVASPDQRDSSGLTSRLVSRRLTDLLSTKLRRPAMSHFRVSAWKAPKWRRLVVFSGSHSVAKCHGFSRPSPHNLHSGVMRLSFLFV